MVAKKSGGRVTPKKATPEENETPTPISGWKKSSEGSPLRVPSGNTAIVRNPGMQVFVSQGMIPNSLMGPIQEALHNGKRPDMSKLEVNEQTLKDMLELADAVVMFCVVDPKVTSNKDATGEILPLEARDADKLYVDEVDVEDKMFIFQYAVGGTRDIERFRKESAESLGDL